MTTAADTNPSVPNDLIEPLLAFIVRLAAASSLWQPDAIAQPLNVLARTHVPLVTKAALMQMPHVDLTFATKQGNISLLNLMLQWSKKPRGRPLNYSSQKVLENALKCDSTHVLDWWLDRPGILFLNWKWSDSKLMEAFCEPADLKWLQWWKARGYPFLESEDDVGPSTFERMAVEASQKGRVDILDWLLENDVSAHWMMSANGEDGGAIVGAAQHGQVHVLEWWVTKMKAGALDAKMDWIQVFSAAFSSGHVGVVEWCKSQPTAMAAWQQGLNDCSNRSKKISSMCWDVASKEGLGRDWLHAFDLLPFAEGDVNVSCAACKKGDLDLVKELHSRGYLLGSRKQLVHAALKSGKLVLLEWIQANVDPSIPDASGWCFSMDPFDVACDRGVDVLDWLLANGFQFPPLGEKRASIFTSALNDGQIDVLEWLFKNSFARNMSMEDWSRCLKAATNKGRVDVLDWLAERIPRIGAVTEPTKDQTSISMPEGRVNVRMLQRAFHNGQVDVLEWWMHKSGWLKDVFDLTHNQPYLYACNARNGGRAEAQLAALKAWVHAGQPISFADCIHEASISGRIDVLDWLLHTVCAPEEDFVKAWSSNEFPSVERYSGSTLMFRGFDTENHGESLLWWHANLPHICTQLPVNRGPYDNPIHAHIFTFVLINTSFEVLDPWKALGEMKGMMSGGVPIFEYWRQHCDAAQVEELREKVKHCLEVASEYGLCDVLEWFKVVSGIPIKCPTAIAMGITVISRQVGTWWEKSGLVDMKQLATMELYTVDIVTDGFDQLSVLS